MNVIKSITLIPLQWGTSLMTLFAYIICHTIKLSDSRIRFYWGSELTEKEKFVSRAIFNTSNFRNHSKVKFTVIVVQLYTRVCTHIIKQTKSRDSCSKSSLSVGAYYKTILYFMTPKMHAFIMAANSGLTVLCWFYQICQLSVFSCSKILTRHVLCSVTRKLNFQLGQCWHFYSAVIIWSPSVDALFESRQRPTLGKC